MDVIYDFQGELSGLELSSIAIIDEKTLLGASHEFVYRYQKSELVDDIVKREEFNSSRMKTIKFISTL